MHTRREFLKVSIGGPLVLSLAPSVPWLLWRSAAQAAQAKGVDGRVLVVLQLSGGNDGLNTVVPFEDDHYARSRPTLRLPTPELHKLNSQLGLHPRMGAFYRLFQEGKLTVLQGVGCPGGSRDHERAMFAWQTAAPQPDGVDTGWVGRAADFLWARSATSAPAVFVGDIPRPFGVNAAAAVVPCIRGGAGPTVFAGSRQPIAALPEKPAGSLLRHVRRCATEGFGSNARLEEVAKHGSTVTYPAFGLARELQTIASLIRADVGVRIFYAELGGGGIGGFDNHANQLGNHCALLEQLSESVAAFAADLSRDGLLDRVLLLTFSEFGRTVAENGRRGTDHGNAGPLFLVGGKQPAGIRGTHPSLTDLDGDALKHRIDFRSVYAYALQDWLGLDAAPILGQGFAPMELG